MSPKQIGRTSLVLSVLNLAGTCVLFILIAYL